MKITLFIESIGLFIFSFIESLGNYILLALKTLQSLFLKRFPFHILIQQIMKIGYESMAIIAFTSLFMGMVLAFSTGVYLDTKLKGVAAYTGGTITIAFIREMGPVLTALLLAGRSGSSTAAEIGTMVVTEQVDAMISMGIQPIQYLILPRILAGILVTPILVFISDAMGIVGGSIIAVSYVHQTLGEYYVNVSNMLQLDQIFLGFVKSLVFGFLVLFISAAKGFFVKGGSEAVGQATTQAVVLASIICVIADYIVTSLLN